MSEWEGIEVAPEVLASETIKNLGGSVPKALEMIVNQEKMIGKAAATSLALPDPDDIESWTEVNKKFVAKAPEELGWTVPETANDYKLALPEGMEYAEKEFKEYVESLHELGIPTGTAKPMVDKWLEAVGQAREEATGKLDDSKEFLKDHYGRGYDKVMSFVEGAISKHGGDKASQITDAISKMSPEEAVVHIDAWRAVGEAMGEDTTAYHRAKRLGGSTPDEIRQKIQDIETSDFFQRYQKEAFLGGLSLEEQRRGGEMAKQKLELKRQLKGIAA